ncbi:MAG: PAS domain S-box protein, partial [Magnetospirillum sp.]
MRTDRSAHLPVWILVSALVATAALLAGGGGTLAVPALAAAGVALAAGVTMVRERRPGAAGTPALAGALDSETRAVLVVGPSGTELFRNPAGRRLLGDASDPLIGLKQRAAADDRTLAEMERLDAAAAVGAPRRTEVALATAGGGREWFALEVKPAGPGGAVAWLAEDISARRAIEETLRRENELLSDFVDFLPVGCYSADADGTVRYVNQRLAEWLGKSGDEIVGHNLAEVFGAVPNPEEERAELRLRGRSGEIFQGLVTHSVYDEGGEMFTRSVVVRDLVPEQQWERALRAAERRFRWLFDDAPVGIALVDLDGTI